MKTGTGKARRGGHAPGHLREAFDQWVEQSNATSETVTVEIRHEETTKPIAWLWGKLWNCSDTMPGGLCGQLDMHVGSTYAQAVRALKAEARAKKAK
jgi:hypothetical protein